MADVADRPQQLSCSDCAEDNTNSPHATLHRYRDEERHLTARLTELPVHARTTLAALTAVRLLPYFLRFHAETGKGDPHVLGRALDDVWRKLEDGTPVTLPTMLAAFDQIQIAADSPGPLAGLAWYSAAAVTNACHVAVHGEVRETLHCLRYGREASLAAPVASGRAEPDSPRVCWRHAALREEVRRQVRDLDDVARAASRTARASPLT
ncbi:DUF416 family protein [Streptomyces chattanoogensis]|uniref:DUF416 family protein n=1 Tax=Streptomyces chattanoogensis TaxID=66876 RepID=UPI0005D87356|nr:hypothetical protein T261_0144 [Streptomyces lydicus]